MKKVFLVFLLICGSGANATSQQIDRISKTVVFLQHDSIETFADDRGTFEVWLKRPNTNSFLPKISSLTGTGFLTSHSNFFYLVTAKHIATNLGFAPNDTVITALSNGKHAVVPLASLRGSNTNGWIHHVTTDVSILPVSPAAELAGIFQEHFLESSFLEAGSKRPSRDVTLTILGFPLGMGWGKDAGGDFAPISKRTRAASGFLFGGTLLLLEDPSVQGYSGSPVFDLADPILSGEGLHLGGRKMGCFGLVSATISDNTGGKMAGIVPAKFILELMMRYEAKL